MSADRSWRRHRGYEDASFLPRAASFLSRAASFLLEALLKAASFLLKAASFLLEALLRAASFLLKAAFLSLTAAYLSLTVYTPGFAGPGAEVLVGAEQVSDGL